MNVGNLFALISGLIWGGGDFCGGLAARKSSPYQVLVISAFTGMLLLAACALIAGETIPSRQSLMWAAAAGLSGSFGILALYRGLASGHMAAVAPTAAVTGAVIPVFFSAFTEGMPDLAQLAGILLAIVGIWLVTRTADPGAANPVSQTEIGLAFIAGVGFSGFFIFISQIDSDQIFAPLVATRFTALLVALFMLRILRNPSPRLTSNRWAILAGLLDGGGNVFYFLAVGYTRLDVAVILASLYPVTTVALAQFVTKEKIRSMQWIGVLVCFIAVVLISL